MSALLKWPLIVAAIVVVLRVVVERAGAPDSIANWLSVAALHTVLVPLYFAIQIVRQGIPRPYGTFLKSITVYVVLVRLMVIPTYWLARIYEWTQPRFYGLWGPDVDPFYGYITLPFQTAAFWIVGSIVFGGIIGSIVIAIGKRRRPETVSATGRTNG
jgi:hypothetical protein